LAKISAIFWDVGGVLLSNAWDREQRQGTLQHFGLDEVEFESRHEMLVSSFERGKITLQEYLERTIF
jgi:putative hydrolase of the HAD superfamily